MSRSCDIDTGRRGLAWLPAAAGLDPIYPAPDGDEGGGIWVTAGTFAGPMSITVETFESAAEGIPDAGEWEIRQEVAVTAQGANLRVETEAGPRIDLPVLQLAPGERAGMRIYARGG